VRWTTESGRGQWKGAPLDDEAAIVKIRVKDHVTLSSAKMAKVALATTSRAQLDLYCVAPGQSQAVHTHADQDKIYYVIEGSGHFVLGEQEERLGPGEALVAAAGVEHGVVNDGPEPLLLLVVVTPPPPHGAGRG
jgi:mannose-6-phosphate isomerase-like protein (cupin superfamily)